MVTMTWRWLRRTALSLSLLMITSIVNGTDVCDLLCSCLEVDSDYVIVNCKGYKNHHPEIDFEMMEWPTTPNRSIKAFFNNMSIHLLPKISGDSNVVSLNFDDNLIRTIPSNPFEYFTNLESISVANNLITDLTRDFLKSTSTLQTLNLSNNSLSNIDPRTVEELKELREVDLSLNELTKLSADLMEALSSVQIMKVENNKLYTIDAAHNKVDYDLMQLFLGFNQFTVVTVSMFEKFKKLEAIDLSFNKIKNIDENAFASLTALKLLDLSHNNIKRVNVELPESLQLLSMAHNQLVTWPLAKTPNSLEELELQDNSLEHVFPKDRIIASLRSLDVSKNLIEHLPSTQFIKLDKLSLSYNRLTAVPQNINTMTPLLHDLVLDGNPIEEVYFNEKVTLGSISLKFMPNLEVLGPGAFSNLIGVKTNADGSGTCIDVHISFNEYLREIDERAFEGVDLCLLDLSYNQIMQIPRNLTDWSKIQEGIDLQGNPLVCNCEDQWMLEEILNKLYSDHDLQFLLIDLKCRAPEELAGLRFVQFLNHENPFCGLTSRKQFEKIQMYEDPNTAGIFSGSWLPDKNIQLELTQGPGFIIIVTLCVLILVVMILVGIKWQRDQDRKLAMRNRLYEYDY